MKKIAFTLIASFLFNLYGYTQTCNMAMKDGSKININILSWTNPLLMDMKFQKSKEEKKDEQIAAYNEGIISGKTPPSSTYPMTYTVKKAAVKDGDEYTLTTNINGTDYSSYFVCSNDTLYISRNRGPIEVPDGKGGIYGYSIQGTQKLPMNLKVGDVLPTFQDVGIVFPTSTDMTVKKQVFSHNTTSTTTEFGYATDSYTGQTGYGEYYKTTTKAVYNTIDVNVRRTLSSSAHFIHYMNAVVIGEEEVTVNGVKYKAYIIDSESWSKSKMEVSFESADEEVNKQQKLFMEKAINKVGKIQKRYGFTNELGYMVMYKTEWFVPSIGMVKVKTYDTNGGIASETIITGLE